MPEEFSESSKVNENLRSLLYHLLLSDHGDRRDIANQLHDNIATNLLCCNIKLKILQEKEICNRNLASSLAEIQEQVSQIISSVKQLSSEISPIYLHELGLESAIVELVRNVGHKCKVVVNFEHDRAVYSLEDGLTVILYQSIRELLRNAVRYSFAENISISILKVDDHLEVTVEDDGIGFDYPKFMCSSKEKNKTGLLSIQECLRYIGGYFEVQSQPGCGTRATIFVPLKTVSTL